MDKKLERNEHNKMVAGVAAGLADYLDIDVTLVRICFILLAVFGFSGVLIYIVMWIAIPEKPFFNNFSNFNPNYKVQEEHSANFAYQPPFIVPKQKKSNSGRIVFGLILVAIGTFFMLSEFDIIPDWFSIFKLWPVILIACGLVILFKSGSKKVDSTFEPSAPIKDAPTEDSLKPDPQPLT